MGSSFIFSMIRNYFYSNFQIPDHETIPACNTVFGCYSFLPRL
jgi:hypothetical protein